MPKSKYLVRVRDRIQKVLSEKGIGQNQLSSLAAKQGYMLSQSTISKILNDCACMSITNLMGIANTLDLDWNDLLSESDSLEVRTRTPREDEKPQGRLISNPDSQEMQPYLGQYYTYFFPTVSSENRTIEGTLSFTKVHDERGVAAEFSFETGKRDANNLPIKKEYRGRLTLSPAMSAAYCELINKDIGEISYLIFNYNQFLFEKVRCRMALVLTASAGLNRVPTVHRMILSRIRMSQESLGAIEGQLYLNDSKILISKSSFEKFLADENLDHAFVDSFIAHKNLDYLNVGAEVYYYFDESLLRNVTSDVKTKTAAISLLRKYSTSPKYTKVSNRCDDYVFQILK